VKKPILRPLFLYTRGLRGDSDLEQNKYGRDICDGYQSWKDVCSVAPGQFTLNCFFSGLVLTAGFERRRHSLTQGELRGATMRQFEPCRLLYPASQPHDVRMTSSTGRIILTLFWSEPSPSFMR
jgi:hypothetical protein